MPLRIQACYITTIFESGIMIYYEVACQNVVNFMLLLPGNEKFYGNAGNRASAPELLDDHLKTVLVNVRLVYLLEREGWDSTPNWEDVLSLGEQQRLGMVSHFKLC